VGTDLDLDDEIVDENGEEAVGIPVAEEDSVARVTEVLEATEPLTVEERTAIAADDEDAIPFDEEAAHEERSGSGAPEATVDSNDRTPITEEVPGGGEEATIDQVSADGLAESDPFGGAAVLAPDIVDDFAEGLADTIAAPEIVSKGARPSEDDATLEAANDVSPLASDHAPSEELVSADQTVGAAEDRSLSSAADTPAEAKSIPPVDTAQPERVSRDSDEPPTELAPADASPAEVIAPVEVADGEVIGTEQVITPHEVIARAEEMVAEEPAVEEVGAEEVGVPERVIAGRSPFLDEPPPGETAPASEQVTGRSHDALFKTVPDPQKLHAQRTAAPSSPPPFLEYDPFDEQPVIRTLDDFNPARPRPITDPLSRQACKNCGVHIEDISHPSEFMITAYTRDPELRPFVRAELEKRAERTLAMVRAERNRLAAAAADLHQKQRKREWDERDARALIEERRRLHMQNRRQAEAIFLEIFLQAELDSEARAAAELERRKQEDAQLAVKKRRMEDMRAAMKRRKAMAQAEAAERAAEAELRRSTEAAQAAVAARRSKMEKERRARFAEIEEAYRIRSEKARAVLEAQEVRRMEEYEKMRIKLAIREEGIRKRRRLEQEEREQAAKEREETAAKKVEAAKEHHEQIIAEKRRKAKEKEIRQCEAFDRNRMWIESDLEMRREQHREDEERHKEQRTRMMNEITVTKQARFEEKEARAASVLRRQMAEAAKKRQQEALQHRFHIEENYQKAGRMATLKVSRLAEKAVPYEERLMTLEQKEQARRKEFAENEIMMIRLEKETGEILDGIAARARATPENLATIAKKLGIDLAVLQEKAKQSRRRIAGQVCPATIPGKTGPPVIRAPGTARKGGETAGGRILLETH
jgi:hypothetical protein